MKNSNLQQNNTKITAKHQFLQLIRKDIYSTRRHQSLSPGHRQKLKIPMTSQDSSLCHRQISLVLNFGLQQREKPLRLQHQDTSGLTSRLRGSREVRQRPTQRSKLDLETYPVVAPNEFRNQGRK